MIAIFSIVEAQRGEIGTEVEPQTVYRNLRFFELSALFDEIEIFTTDLPAANSPHYTVFVIKMCLPASHLSVESMVRCDAKSIDSL